MYSKKFKLLTLLFVLSFFVLNLVCAEPCFLDRLKFRYEAFIGLFFPNQICKKRLQYIYGNEKPSMLTQKLFDYGYGCFNLSDKESSVFKSKYSGKNLAFMATIGLKAPTLFVNEFLFPYLPYGAKKQVAFHEIVHLKQCKQNRFNSFMQGYISPVCREKYKHIEQEADLTALKMLNCSKCMTEAVGTFSDDSRCLDGYASTDDFINAIMTCSSKNALCGYHQAYKDDFLVKYEKPIIVFSGVLVASLVFFGMQKISEGFSSPKLLNSLVGICSAGSISSFLSLCLLKHKENLPKELELKIALGKLKP